MSGMNILTVLVIGWLPISALADGWAYAAMCHFSQKGDEKDFYLAKSKV